MLWLVPMAPVFLDWLERFTERLVEGAPAVTALLAKPPFAGQLPRTLRLRVNRHRFATPHELATTGHRWTRKDLGPVYAMPFVRSLRGLMGQQ